MNEFNCTEKIALKSHWDDFSCQTVLAVNLHNLRYTSLVGMSRMLITAERANIWKMQLQWLMRFSSKLDAFGPHVQVKRTAK